MNKMNRKGFTLAELLIVVAIIAVLVAIAIPVFTTQLEKSKETTDIANLRAAYAAGTVAALTGEKVDNVDVLAATATLWYNPNKDGSLEKDNNFKCGQGTGTNGKADLNALSGGIMTYDNETSVKGQGIKCTFTNGVLTSVEFAS